MSIPQMWLMRRGFRGIFQRISSVSPQRSLKTQPDVDPEDDELNRPITYSTSPAASWRARHSFQGGNQDDVPWFQPYVVMASTAAFLVYFLYLRKPNDIDQIFDRELGDYFDVSNDDLRKRLGQNTVIRR
ncbi:uncharacterized protein [Fopius arisanus]|uniref:Uncharacterized protein isoform X2 n=1 Tax=Fopius arisanus TaxID=64838 RepID=A0A9R1TH06_9HYME|nr:PREDICTED: uncharacterized protein LOC105270815 isoform X2 [Fopius arisanus]